MALGGRKSLRQFLRDARQAWIHGFTKVTVTALVVGVAFLFAHIPAYLMALAGARVLYGVPLKYAPISDGSITTVAVIIALVWAPCVLGWDQRHRAETA